MTHEEFDQLLERRLNLIRDILSNKAVEYATEDRLYNFKRAAVIGETTPALALKGMLLKHLVCVFDLIDAYDGIDIHLHTVVDEKIGDSINYLILLEAILKESPTYEE